MRALLPLLACALPLSAQRPPLHQRDTVRVFPKGNAAPVQGTVLSLSADSLVLSVSAFAIRDISRIEIGRGQRTNRASTLKWVVGGLVSGAAAGLAVGSTRKACQGCSPEWPGFVQLGAEIGAGAGLLLSRRHATADPAWYPIWPLPPGQIAAAAETRDTTLRLNLEPAYFSNIPPGRRVKAWVGDSIMVTGRFATLSQNGTAMDLLNQPSVPLRSIDVLQVGHGHGPQGMVIGAVGLTLPMSFLAALACGLGGGCDNNRVTAVLVGSAVVGGTIGGLIGANQITWETRFRR